MQLKKTEYKTIEIAEDEDYGMVVGNIVMDDNNMLYAEITGGTMCNHEELANVRAFLDKVEEAMETGTLPTILNWSHDIEMLPDSLWSVIQQKDVAIEELKDQNVRDLRELYDIYEAEIFAIKAVRKTAMILSKEIINSLESKLVEKQVIIDRITNLRSNEIEKLYGLEAELSAHKRDSEVLMKVADITRKWNSPSLLFAAEAMNMIVPLVKDYLDTPEETPTPSAYTVGIDIRCE